MSSRQVLQCMRRRCWGKANGSTASCCALWLSSRTRRGSLAGQRHRGLLHPRVSSTNKHAGHAQALLEHGRLRYDQLLRYVAQQQDAPAAELAGTVEACFLRLLHAQQVERVPSCDLPPPVDATRSAASVGSWIHSYWFSCCWHKAWSLLAMQAMGAWPCRP